MQLRQKTPAKKSQSAKLSREDIDSQTISFLQGGGTVQEIPSGKSGLDFSPKNNNNKK